MIELLPKISICGNYAMKFDTESKTALELNAMTYGKMNELITTINEFVDSVNKKITDFNNDANADREVFEIAMRQEFQDFIDVVEIKYQAQEQVIDNKIAACIREVNAKVAECERAVDAFIAEVNGAIDDIMGASY